MPFDDLRPILSGIAGAAVAAWLGSRLERWIPHTTNGKPAEVLLREHRNAIRAANAASAFGILGGLALYQWAGFASNDWRPFGLGFGFAMSAPWLVLPLAAWLSRRNARECIVGFAISQHAPLAVLIALLLLGLPLFAVALAKLL